MLTDFVETLLISALATLLFLGGWQVPFLMADGFHGGSNFVSIAPLWVTILQVATFFIKVSIFMLVFLLVRWSLPRFRYDQLMRLGWNIMLPLSLLNVFVTGLILMVWDKR